MTKREIADWLVDLCLMFGSTDEEKVARLKVSQLGREQLPAIRAMTIRQLRRALKERVR